MSIGSVLDEAWTLFTRFFLRFFLIAALVFGPINLIYAVIRTSATGDGSGTVLLVAIVGVAATIVGATWLQGAFVYAVQDARDGTFDATVGQVFSRVASSVAALVGAGILAGLGVALGLILLIAPGLFLMTIWSVIAPVIVVEKRRALAIVRPVARARPRPRLDRLRDRAHHRPALGSRGQPPPGGVLVPPGILRGARREHDRAGDRRAVRRDRAGDHVLPASRSARRAPPHPGRDVTLDPETEARIEEPVSADAVREARLTPAEAIEHMRIRLPERGNRKLRRVLERANADSELKGWWHVSNVNAVVRLQINDHSWVHIQIVANIALKLLRQLTKHGVEPSVVRDYGMQNEDAEVVVVLAALTHCVGMSVHRRGHEDWSLFLAEPKLRELLDGIYDEPDRTVIVCEVLQAITSHRADGEPLSLEAGILRVGDALDMAKGRSRIPFEKGQVSMHSLSAAAIDEILIADGETKPVRIEIVMNNSSGLFQVDGLLKAKLRGSGLEPHVEVIAHIDTADEKRLVPEYRLEI